LEGAGEGEGRGGCVVLVFIGGDMFGSFVEISEENPSSTVSVNGGRCQPIDSITFFETACNAPRSELSYVPWMTNDIQIPKGKFINNIGEYHGKC
jgi:hypothetical protein